MTPQKEEPAPPKSGTQGLVDVPLKLRGDTISYALHHLAYNIGANFYEPSIEWRLQKKWYDRHKNGADGYGNYRHNLAGQFAGDVSGVGGLIAAELLFPNQLHRFSRSMRRVVNPLYTSVAHYVLADQREKPDYDKQIKEWATYQERNLVRSGIIGASSIVGNIALQKAIGNKSPTHVIFGTKMVTTALTTVLSLTARFALPKQTKWLDNAINDKIVMPLLEEGNAQHSEDHVSNLLKDRAKTDLQPAR